MLFLCFIFLVLRSQANDSTYDHSIVLTDQFEKIASSIPEWNETTKRWYMYSDHWQSRMDGNYSLKGNVLEVGISPVNKNMVLNLFSNPSLLNSQYQLGYKTLYKNKNPVCEFTGMSPYTVKAKKSLICKFATCIPGKENTEIRVSHFPDRMSKYKESKSPCDENYYPASFSGDNDLSKWAFELIEVSKKIKAYKVKVNGELFYISFESCVLNSCHVSNIQYSGLEKLFYKNYIHSLKRDIPSLTYLEDEIKKCTSKDSNKCISKLLIGSGEIKELATHTGLISKEDLNSLRVDDNDFAEIKACLGYSRLMQITDTFIFTKGINKVCIIPTMKLSMANPYKVLTVTFPENVVKDHPITREIVKE